MGEPAIEAISVLIRRAAYGQALQATSDALGESLGRFCMAALGDQGEAEETLAELLETVYEAMPRLEQTPLRPFLFGTALGLCRRRLSDDGAVEPAAASGTAEAGPASTRRDLARLNDLERELLLLRYVGRLGYAEAAALCGVDKAEAIRLVGRGLLSLRQVRRESGARVEDPT